MRNKILRVSLGTLIMIGALYLGQAFWIYFVISFGTILSIFIIPIMLGYIYIAIGLAGFKKWAWGIFLIIITLAILLEILLVFIHIAFSKKALVEWFYVFIFIVAAITIPVFGITALIRRLKRKVRATA